MLFTLNLDVIKPLMTDLYTNNKHSIRVYSRAKKAQIRCIPVLFIYIKNNDVLQMWRHTAAAALICSCSFLCSCLSWKCLENTSKNQIETSDSVASSRSRRVKYSLTENADHCCRRPGFTKASHPSWMAVQPVGKASRFQGEELLEGNTDTYLLLPPLVNSKQPTHSIETVAIHCHNCYFTQFDTQIYIFIKVHMRKIIMQIFDAVTN